MAKVRTTPLTPELTGILISMIKDAPDDLMVDVGRRCLKGGFTNPEAVRQRLCVTLESSAPLESWFVALVRCGLTARDLVGLFSADALRSVFEPLAALGGRNGLLLGALFDPREDVHKVAAEIIAKPPPAKGAPDFEANKRALLEWLESRITKPVGITLVPRHCDAASEGETTEELTEVNVDEIISTMNELRKAAEGNLKTIENLRRGIAEQGRKQQSRLDAAAKRTAEEKKKIVAEREEARRQLLRAQKENTALAARLEELNAAQQQVIDRGVEEHTSVILRKWLDAPRETERVLEQVNGSDLFARIDQAIESQARQDRLTGNRVELERQLVRLREARERLQGAASTALCPVSNLRELLAEVDTEIARIEKALTGQRPVDSFTERLLVTINHARTWEQARDISTLIERLEDAELVRGEDRRRLFDALQRKFSLLDETSRARHEEHADHGWSLRNALYRNLPTLLLLDGHNIMFGLDDLFRPHFSENGRPGRAARDRLVALVRKLIESRTNVHAHILFDAPHHEVVTISPNIILEFSGGRGEHRADRVIADHVAWRRPSELGQIRYVVTDDRAVRRDANKHGAFPVPIDLFAVFLNDFNCLNANPQVAA